MADQELISRQVISIDINTLLEEISSNKFELLDTSLLAIKFNIRTTPFDIGSWCYQKRERNTKYKVFVQVSTLLVQRKNVIANILSSILLELSSGKSEHSLLLELKTFERFLSWSDRNNKFDVFDSLKKARECLINYIQILRLKVREESISLLTAVTNQNYCLKWLALGLDIDQSPLIEGICLLKKNVNTVNSTIAPLDKEAKYQLKCYSQILIQITDLLINFKPLPYKLLLPNQKIWLMPQRKIFATSNMLESRNDWKSQFRALDYKNGRIYEPSEIKKFYSNRSQLGAANKAVRDARKLQSEINSNPKHSIRISLFSYAQAAFFNLFLANTGMNSKQAFELDWHDEFKTVKALQGIKVVKYRAKGKLQEFQITATFLSTFKLFLKLRSFILNKEKYAKLFLTYENEKASTQYIYNASLTFITRKYLSQLIGSNPITPREWRAYKAVKVMEQTKGDIKLTSQLLQNTTSTLIRSYGNISLGIATEEFYTFFERLGERSKESYQTTPAGGCIALGEPESKHHKLSPNCNTYEHCLICDKYAFHADKEDIWKVLSMKYVILETQHLAYSIDHFNELFSEVLLKIEQVIQGAIETSKITKDEVEFMRNKIHKEELFPYWQNKLNLLVSVGAL